MFYQKMHMGDPPYILNFGKITNGFPIHKHVEIELFYCLRGKVNLAIDRKKYKLEEGQLAIVGSMISHEVLESMEDPTTRTMEMEIGPAMMGEYFKAMVNEPFANPIIDLKKEEYKKMRELFDEIYTLHKKSTSFSSILTRGNVYKISAYILKEFVTENNHSIAPKKIKSVSQIEKSLEYIYNNYEKKIAIDEVAEMCGYSTSNFCKIFKSITGDTFHNTLNNYRIRMACTLLEGTDFSIENVALNVGFSDLKSFCRIFKSIKGISPGQYRKEISI